MTTRREFLGVLGGSVFLPHVAGTEEKGVNTPEPFTRVIGFGPYSKYLSAIRFDGAPNIIMRGWRLEGVEGDEAAASVYVRWELLETLQRACGKRGWFSVSYSGRLTVRFRGKLSQVFVPIKSVGEGSDFATVEIRIGEPVFK